MKTLNILLVEDSRLDAELIEVYLIDGGIEYDLLCVETREEFVAALENNSFDIILADYMLPGFNGIAALEIARATCPQLPFIFVSAPFDEQLGEEVAIETLKSGATDYVIKPRLTRLVPSIQRAMREVQERMERKQAEAQRQESEDRFRIVADTAPVMIWMSDSHKVCHYFNKVWRSFTGRTLEQEMGNGWMEGVHPDDLQHYLETRSAAFEAEAEYRAEYRLRRFDGEYRWVLGTGVPRYRPDGTFAGYIGSCIDIGDRFQAEKERATALVREQVARTQAEATAQELLEANWRITNILETISDSFVSVDLEWKYTYVNRKALEFLGKSKAELIGKNMWEVFPDAVNTPGYKMAQKALAEGLTLEYEEFHAFQNQWLVVRCYPSEYGLSIYFQDITDRKQTEAALKASSAKLRCLVEANLIGILFGDVDGDISEANDEFLRMVGYRREDLQGGKIRWIDITPPEYLSLDEIKIAEAKATGVCTPYEKEYLRPDGSRIPALVGYILLGENRQESVAFILDLSERKQLEIELQNRAEELARVNRIKDDFLATLSHELRTPLNVILGWTQLLRYQKFDETTTVRALETIDRNSRALGTLIEDLLDVSQIIAGKLPLNFRCVDLRPSIQAAIDTCAPAARAKNIEIVTEFDQTIGSIYGDSERLQQVAWNLISNAIKFTPNGGVVAVAVRKVEGAFATKLPEGENLLPAVVEIEVEDTGGGISPEFLPRVFERFSQADSTTTRSYNGLGMGLAIVRHLVEMHGGTVKAESAGNGKGARFLVKLPMQQTKDDFACFVAEPGQFLMRQKSEIAPVDELFVSTNLSGVRVLVVDRDEDTRNFARAVLEDCGAEVETVVSVAEVLEAMERLNPDVLVSDIGLPMADGNYLLRQVRSICGCAKIPAVAFTAYGRVEERVRALREGFQLHLPKPIDPAELVAAVASLVISH
ncbi:MAG: PAS domain S-box protein [Microcoleus sp.]